MNRYFVCSTRSLLLPNGRLAMPGSELSQAEVELIPEANGAVLVKEGVILVAKLEEEAPEPADPVDRVREEEKAPVLPEAAEIATDKNEPLARIDVAALKKASAALASLSDDDEFDYDVEGETIRMTRREARAAGLLDD